MYIRGATTNRRTWCPPSCAKAGRHDARRDAVPSEVAQPSARRTVSQSMCAVRHWSPSFLHRQQQRGRVAWSCQHLAPPPPSTLLPQGCPILSLSMRARGTLPPLSLITASRPLNTPNSADANATGPPLLGTPRRTRLAVCPWHGPVVPDAFHFPVCRSPFSSCLLSAAALSHLVLRTALPCPASMFRHRLVLWPA